MSIGATQSVGAFNGVTSLVGKVVSVPAGLVSGTIAGISDGIQSSQSIPLVTSTTGSYFSIVNNFIRSLFGNFISDGKIGIAGSGAKAAYSEALMAFGGKGTGEAVSKLFGSLQNVGGKGLGLLGLNFLGAGVGLYSGISHTMASWQKFSDSMRGWRTDVVNSPLVHATDMGLGMATAAGSLMMLFPGTMALGLPLMATGMAGTWGMSLVKWAGWGNHWFNLPETAPFGVSNAIKSIRNTESYLRS